MSNNDGLSQASRGVGRRRVLSLAGGTAAVVLAGCLGDDEADDGTDAADEVAPDGDETDETTPPEPGDQPDSPADRYDLPLTGERNEHLDSIDETMFQLLLDEDLEGGVLGVAHEGELIHERGYGYADVEEETPVAPDAFVRIGSISKTLTDAAIYELVERGDLAYDERVMPLLAVEPPAGEPADSQFSEITVRHLLDHEAGLPPSREPTITDPVFAPRQVAAVLEQETPPTTADYVRYLLDQELHYPPGDPDPALDPYSNSGYVVLTHLIEAVTGQSYQAVLEELVLPDPDEVGVARADPAERHPREVAYHDEATVPTALDPAGDEDVSMPDGGFLLAPIVGAGGHFSSTAGLLSFMQEYWMYFGEPREDEPPVENPAALGSLPGALAVAFHHDDVDVVAMFNRRPEFPSRWEAILENLRQAVDRVDNWEDCGCDRLE